MAKGAENHQNGKSVGDDLEPYRRLIEIQKELVHMSKQHEATRREFDALRERVARELTAPARGKNGVPQRLRRSVARLLNQLSRLTAAGQPVRPLKAKPAHVKSR